MIENSASNFSLLASGDDTTVVSEYEPFTSDEQHYQSEAELEATFIRQLGSQAYERLHIHNEADLIVNLRKQLSRLNNYEFTNSEWQRFYTKCIAAQNDSIESKAQRIQIDSVQLLHRDDGTSKNISLIDKSNIHNNHVQVINQYSVPGQSTGASGALHANRYDVTILVNGLPMVHVELKRRGVHLQEAFNQISRYQRDSFWAGSGLFEYVQLFVISNGTHTKYYSNTTRKRHIESALRNTGTKRSQSYEFTSYWADGKNNLIQDLENFTRTFFAKRTLLNILTRFCIWTVDQSLLVMRPYQIYATEQILQKITISENSKTLGTVKAGGYIWHTTGSGKTLTSFKTAQLASRMPSVDKVLFVVDRKDLDYQTMAEYDRFEKGAANSNASTKVLERQLSDPTARIIITTIQKLSTFISRNKVHPVYHQRVVMIFDECHRSQFGDMHRTITKAFKQYNIFGFTGTPIFAENSGSSVDPHIRTTEQAFGDKLHTYTVVDAIADKNVLPFRIAYVNTVKAHEDIEDTEVYGVNTEPALLSPERISSVVNYILKHFDQQTLRTSAGSYNYQRITNVKELATAKKRGSVQATKHATHTSGFNSLLATASIPAAQAYYREFKKQQADFPESQRLKIGIIYSYAPNHANDDLLLHDEEFASDRLSRDDRDFLDLAINDYNSLFATNYDTSGQSFENYYKDLSFRLKNRELDLVIVVNMFLTGFDATTLNTLWVDKNLQYHGLIQAFSRTNRILNSVKQYGNIVCFRNLETATNNALSLFGNKEAQSTVVLQSFDHYYDQYSNLVEELLAAFSPGQPIRSEEAQRRFISIFGSLLRKENLLSCFDEFVGKALLTPRQMQDFKSQYLDLYAAIRQQESVDKVDIQEDVIFEMELIKKVDINVDYILGLVEEYRKAYGNGEEKEIKAEITRNLNASPTLRRKKELIEAFVESLNVHEEVPGQWKDFVLQAKEQELEALISAEQLQPELTRSLVERTLAADGMIPTSGVEVANILPRRDLFATPGKNGHGEIKHRVTLELQDLVSRYYGVVSVA